MTKGKLNKCYWIQTNCWKQICWNYCDIIFAQNFQYFICDVNCERLKISQLCYKDKRQYKTRAKNIEWYNNLYLKTIYPNYVISFHTFIIVIHQHLVNSSSELNIYNYDMYETYHIWKENCTTEEEIPSNYKKCRTNLFIKIYRVRSHFNVCNFIKYLTIFPTIEILRANNFPWKCHPPL